MIRLTRQREAIEHVFAVENRPLTPAELHAGAQRIMPRIGLRTVYRQLRDMADEGRIVGVDYPGQPLRYERVNHLHGAHFICRRCNRVFNLQIQIDEVAVTAPPGFRVTGQETVLYGDCPGCSESSAAGSADSDASAPNSSLPWNSGAASASASS